MSSEQRNAVPIPKRSRPTMAVLATYTDRELLSALLDCCDEMPNADASDFDLEGLDYYEQITVSRLDLREALRRLAVDK